MRPIITLTTDFGMGAYVAQMKGVLLSACRDVEIVDVTHAIAPQDIMQGAIALADIVPWYPIGTYHWVVVDPGVGSERHLLYAEVGDWRFVLPDNGLLTLVAERWPIRRLVRLTNRQFWKPHVSSTFHGRDIMASVLGHLLQGVNPSLLGEETHAWVRLDLPRPICHLGVAIDGAILTIDRFGNAISNISREHLQATFGDEPLKHGWSVLLEECAVQPMWCRSYADRQPADLVALFDSCDRLEIAVVNGNAAEKHGLAVGSKLSIAPGTPDVDP